MPKSSLNHLNDLDLILLASEIENSFNYEWKKEFFSSQPNLEAEKRFAYAQGAEAWKRGLTEEKRNYYQEKFSLAKEIRSIKELSKILSDLEKDIDEASKKLTK